MNDEQSPGGKNMKKFDFGQTLNTLANAGVVAGIIFLAVELNQNNELLELEARATLSENLQLSRKGQFLPGLCQFPG